MWRFLSNISRGFKNHVHSLRPSVGLYVEEEQEVLDFEKTCPFTGRRRTSVHSDEPRVCSARIVNSLFVNKKDESRETSCHVGHSDDFNTGEKDGSQQKSSCHYDFWRLFQGSHRMLEGSVVLFGADRERNRCKSQLLLRLLLASPGHTTTIRSIKTGVSVNTAVVAHQGININTATVAHQGININTVPHQADVAVTDINETPAVPQETVVNNLQAETLDSVMKEFEYMCTEYTAKTESLLGLEAADQGDFSTAVERLLSSSALGNMSACFNLGLCYETGSGVLQDLEEAKYYYSLAGQQGHSMALYNLGLMCLKCSSCSSHQGQGQESRLAACGCDLVQGLGLLEKAAKLGLAQAQTYLGVHHIEHSQDMDKAVPYFQAAAQQHELYLYKLCLILLRHSNTGCTGQMLAMLSLLRLPNSHPLSCCQVCRFSLGLPHDKSSAMDLFQKAADLGCEQAKQRLEDINCQEATQKAGGTQVPETCCESWDTKMEMFRQLYQQHHQGDHGSDSHHHSLCHSPSVSSPNLSEHFHQGVVTFFFDSELTKGKVYDTSYCDDTATGQPHNIAFRLGSDGEYDDDDDIFSAHSEISTNESFESNDMFPSVRIAHKSHSFPSLLLLASST